MAVPALPDLPSVSVVVPVRDDLPGLERCLEALARQSYPAHRVEVVVADDGSHPALRPADVHGARLVTCAGRGSYAARNAALQGATGDVVAFTDADCRPAPDWLAQGVLALRSTGAGLVAGRVRVTTRPPGRRTGAELYDARHAFPQEGYVRELGFGVTANVLTTRAVIGAVGPFDGSLRSGGDREWGRRVTAAGFAVVYCPDAVVDHPARTSLGQLRRKVVRTHEGDMVLRIREGAPLPLGRLARRAVPPVRHTVRSLRDGSLRPVERLRYLTAYLVVRYSHVLADAREVGRAAARRRRVTRPEPPGGTT